MEIFVIYYNNISFYFVLSLSGSLDLCPIVWLGMNYVRDSGYTFFK